MADEPSVPAAATTVDNTNNTNDDDAPTATCMFVSASHARKRKKKSSLRVKENDDDDDDAAAGGGGVGGGVGGGARAFPSKASALVAGTRDDRDDPGDGVRRGTAVAFAAERVLETESDATRQLETESEGVGKNAGRFGPIRASKTLRTTVLVDFNPDICEDYRKTGFCGYGDTCKFMHDRGDIKSSYIIDREWQEAQKKRRLDEAAAAAEAEAAGNESGDVPPPLPASRGFRSLPTSRSRHRQ